VKSEKRKMGVGEGEIGRKRDGGEKTVSDFNMK
jgi:hypothetical protein